MNSVNDNRLSLALTITTEDGSTLTITTFAHSDYDLLREAGRRLGYDGLGIDPRLGPVVPMGLKHWIGEDK